MFHGVILKFSYATKDKVLAHFTQNFHYSREDIKTKGTRRL